MNDRRLIYRRLINHLAYLSMMLILISIIIFVNLWWIISKLLAGYKKDTSVLRTSPSFPRL
jgi:hypothetical protein